VPVNKKSTRLSSEKWVLFAFEMSQLFYLMKLTTAGIARDLQSCEFKIRFKVARLTVPHSTVFLWLNSRDGCFIFT